MQPLVAAIAGVRAFALNQLPGFQGLQSKSEDFLDVAFIGE
jgi:hypothetical protein